MKKKNVKLEFDDVRVAAAPGGEDDFRAIAAKLKPAVGRVEGFTNILFAGRLTAAYDGELLIALDLGREFAQAIGVRAEPLILIMDRIADSKPDVAVKGSELLISAGGAEYRVPLLDPPPFGEIVDKFVAIPRQKWAPIPKGMLDAIYLCSFYTSRAAQAREDMIGVAVDGTDVLSTDGFRVTWCRASSPMGSDKLFVPPRAAMLLPHTGEVPGLARYRGLDSFCVLDGWLCLRGGGALFCTSLLDYKFPDEKVRSFFKRGDKAGGIKMKIPSALFGVVERALAYRKYEFLLDNEMRLDVGGGKILCEVESKDVGRFREQFAFEDKKVKFSITVNPVFLKEVLQHATHMELLSDSSLRLYSDSFDHLISLR